jgi:hypothetical protein
MDERNRKKNIRVSLGEKGTVNMKPKKYKSIRRLFI